MDLETRLTELRQLAKDFGKWEGKRVYLEAYKHSKRCMLMKGAECEGYKTIAAQEREAYASEEYVQILTALQTATEEAQRLRWELSIAQDGLRAWQTEQANKRAERRAYGA
jgi:hypothetical protein